MVVRFLACNLGGCIDEDLALIPPGVHAHIHAARLVEEKGWHRAGKMILCPECRQAQEKAAVTSARRALRGLYPKRKRGKS